MLFSAATNSSTVTTNLFSTHFVDADVVSNVYCIRYLHCNGKLFQQHILASNQLWYENYVTKIIFELHWCYWSSVPLQIAISHNVSWKYSKKDYNCHFRQDKERYKENIKKIKYKKKVFRKCVEMTLLFLCLSLYISLQTPCKYMYVLDAHFWVCPLLILYFLFLYLILLFLEKYMKRSCLLFIADIKEDVRELHFTIFF